MVIGSSVSTALCSSRSVLNFATLLHDDEKLLRWLDYYIHRPSSNATAEILESSEYGFEEPPEYNEGGPPEYRLEESYELAVDSQPADLRMGERSRLEGHPDSFHEFRNGLHQTPHVGKTITRLVIMRTIVCRALLVPPLFVKNPSVGKNFMLVASPLQSGMTLGSMFVEKVREFGMKLLIAAKSIDI